MAALLVNRKRAADVLQPGAAVLVALVSKATPDEALATLRSQR